MAPHIATMARNIAADLGIAVDAVNVKAKTTERLGFTGRGEGIAAEAIACPAARVSAAASERLRLFFALWPDAAARSALARYAQDAQAACGGRLMRPPNLHVTLAFIGDVDAARLDAILAAASTVAPRRLVLDIDRVEYWRHNRIVWAGASAVPDALVALVDELRAALDAAGVRYDRKAWVPHATLLRDARAAALPPLAPVAWPVEGFVLVKSVPGADYAIVREWRATAA